MGNRRIFSTEQLILLIDSYFKEIQINNISTGRITAESIARYYRESGQEPKLWGHHIRDDDEAYEHINEKIEEINKQIKDRLVVLAAVSTDFESVSGIDREKSGQSHPQT